MTASPQKFANLLTQGLRAIKSIENKNLSVIQDELGFLTKRTGGSMIHHWRKGSDIPTEAKDIELLACEIVRRGKMPQKWLEQFLDSTDYPQTEMLSQKLFPPPLLGNKQPVPPKLNWATLQHICQQIQAKFLEQVYKKYDPTLYLQRQEAIAVFDNFLASPQPILVVTGKSGVGKTNFICSLLTDKDRQKGQICFLGYDSSYLDEDLSLIKQLNREFQRWGNIEDFVTVLKRVSQKTARRFVLLIDALNEYQQPAQLLRHIDRTVYNLSIPCLKVVITSRPETWRQIYRQAKPTETLYYRQKVGSSLGFELTKFQIQTFLADPTDLSYTLPLFQHNEAELVYEKYRHKYDLKTPYPLLSQEVKQAIRDPLILHLVTLMYQGEEIPTMLHPHKIYKNHLNFMVKQGHLRDTDEIFLRQEIVPLMLDNNQYHNQVSFNQLQRHCLQSTTEMKALNNLLDAHILTRQSSGLEDAIHFTFERFYDYFMGEYFLTKSKASPDPVSFIEHLARQIPQTPFLWGAVLTVLLTLFEENNDQLIEALGHSQDELLLQMLTRLLAQYYPLHSKRFKPMLLEWFNQADKIDQTPHLVAYVAIECGDEQLLNMFLQHRTKKIRDLIMKDIYQLWKREPELTQQVLLNLANNIKSTNTSLFSPYLLTLIDASFLLFLQEYNAQTASPTLKNLNAKHNQIENLKVPFALKQIWQPLLADLLKIDFSSPNLSLQSTRRQFLNESIGTKALSFIEKGERERFSFDFASMKTFFPITHEHQNIIQKLIAHCEAAINQAPGPIEDLVKLIIEEVANGEQNFWIIYVAHLSLIAHLKANPLQTSMAIEYLLQEVEKYYPPPSAKNNQIPSMWYPMISHIFTNLRYEDYGAMEPKDAKLILQKFIAILRRRVYLYKDTWRRDPAGDEWRGKPENQLLKLDCLEPLLFGYVLQMPEVGRNVLLELVDFYIKTKDHDHIKWGVYSLAMGINRHELPQVGLETLRDFIQRVQESGYLNNLDENTYTALWKKWEDDLFKYASKYRKDLTDLLLMLDEQLLPDSFKLRLQTTSWQDSIFEFNIMEGITWLFSKATQDTYPNSPVRHLLIKFLENSLHAKSVKELMVSFVIQMVDIVYPEKRLFG